MEHWESFIKKMVELMGFRDYRLEMREGNRAAFFVHDGGVLIDENLPLLVESFNHLFQLHARRDRIETIYFDINNYREERERLLENLARAAAKKASSTKQQVTLPAMNAYERRIVHLSLALHPEVITESMGEGKGRYVIIKPIEESK